MLSPVPAIVAMVMNWAACPLDVASAAAPPSNAAIRFSKTSCTVMVRRMHVGQGQTFCSLEGGCLSGNTGIRIFCKVHSISDSRSRPHKRSGKARTSIRIDLRLPAGARVAVRSTIEDTAVRDTYLRVLEDVARCGVDWRRARVRFRIRLLACVKLEGLELGLSGAGT